MRRITPPLPAASRPSKTTTTFRPCARTCSCSSTSSRWSRLSSLSKRLAGSLFGRSPGAGLSLTSPRPPRSCRPWAGSLLDESCEEALERRGRIRAKPGVNGRRLHDRAGRRRPASGSAATAAAPRWARPAGSPAAIRARPSRWRAMPAASAPGHSASRRASSSADRAPRKSSVRREQHHARVEALAALDVGHDAQHRVLEGALSAAAGTLGLLGERPRRLEPAGEVVGRRPGGGWPGRPSSPAATSQASGTSGGDLLDARARRARPRAPRPPRRSSRRTGAARGPRSRGRGRARVRRRGPRCGGGGRAPRRGRSATAARATRAGWGCGASGRRW